MNEMTLDEARRRRAEILAVINGGPSDDPSNEELWDMVDRLDEVIDSAESRILQNRPF